MSTANERQVGGSHYATKIQHWDFAAANDYDYFQGQVTKYVDRWKRKNGIQDLEKAAHFLQKYIEVEKAKEAAKMVEMSTLKQVRDPNPHPFGYNADEEVVRDEDPSTIKKGYAKKKPIKIKKASKPYWIDRSKKGKK